MKLSTVLTVTAVITFIFGLAFIVAPAASVGLYGSKLDTTGQFIGRYFGAALLALAFVAYLNRENASRGLQVGFFVGMVLGLVVSVYDALAGTHNALVWLNVVIYLLLALGFANFVFLKPTR
jgi:hypothetical protein